MSDRYDELRQQGRELREMRRLHAQPDSPCGRCKREECPQVCFPLRDWNRRRE